MKQEVMEYIKGRVSKLETTVTGDIETKVNVTLDNGTVISGNSLRPIDGFNQEEATTAAYTNAISALEAGVDLFLSKK